MLTVIRVVIVIAALLFSSNAYSACTLKNAQTLMIEGNNMIQVYTRKNIEYIENKQTPPTSFQKKYETIVTEHSELGVKMAQATERNPDIKHEDTIDQSICDGYAAFLASYTPEGYKADPVKMETTTPDPGCNTDDLWAKYGVLIQKQSALAQAGKINDAAQTDMMRLSTEIGEAATTDLKKACALMNKLEAMVNAL